MAKYREDSPKQTRLLPVALSNQIQPGTIEHSINYLVDHHINLSVFASRYNNDKTGAPAIESAKFIGSALLLIGTAMLALIMF